MARAKRKSKFKGRRPKAQDFSTGIIRINRKGFGFVETHDGDFHIPKKFIGPAMNGDRVAVRKEKYGSKGPQASVVRVIERAHEGFVGRFESNGVINVVVPLDDTLAHDFFMDPADHSYKKLHIEDEDIVYARITLYPNRKSAGMCTIERKIGEQSDKSILIEQIIASHSLETEFNEATLKEARELTLDIEEALLDPKRRDLRDELIVTIDPADAKDFDDGVSLNVREDGSLDLGVHIADVTHYVPWLSSIDLSARQRSTSTYLVDRVLPMLPEELSNGLCSLKPHEDRLAMSVFMHIDAAGEIVSSEFYPSVIHSKGRFSYDEVDALLNRDEEALARFKDSEPERYGQILELFGALDSLAQKRKERRERLGGIDFDTVESRVILDDDGVPTGISIRKRTRATSLIEEAMLAANETVARYLDTHRIPSAFRVHDAPEPDALEGLIPLLQEFDLADSQTIAGVVVGNPHVLQDIITRVKGRPEEYLISSSILRSMRRAEYTPNDSGHYGLGMDSYCHFTSPIRRYPDILVHRSLKASLYNKIGKDPFFDEQTRLLPELCKHASIMERETDEAAHQSQKIKIAEYMKAYIGEAFSGIVTGLDTFGIFVRLDETTAEGLLPIRKLGDEWFEFDHEKKVLIGESSNKRYRLGQRIVVVVDSVDLAIGYVNFALPEPKKS
ncbi:MAG: ribonuclease R [Coriobacteriia bacterium]|nr:ribonuclease R [Coriobacteriia bacterium]